MGHARRGKACLLITPSRWCLLQQPPPQSGFNLAWRIQPITPPQLDGGDGVTLVDATHVLSTFIAAFDRRFFLAPRDAFLALWDIAASATAPESPFATAPSSALCGANSCRRGTKIGPLCADNLSCALALLGDL